MSCNKLKAMLVACSKMPNGNDASSFTLICELLIKSNHQTTHKHIQKVTETVDYHAKLYETHGQGMLTLVTH